MLQNSSSQPPGLSNIWFVSKNLHDGQSGPESDPFYEPTSEDSTSSPNSFERRWLFDYPKGKKNGKVYTKSGHPNSIHLQAEIFQVLIFRSLIAWSEKAEVLSSATRPVWTGFKIAVRPKLLTHLYKVNCIHRITNWIC